MQNLVSVRPSVPWPFGTAWNTWGTFENHLDHTRLTPAMLRTAALIFPTGYSIFTYVSVFLRFLKISLNEFSELSFVLRVLILFFNDTNVSNVF